MITLGYKILFTINVLHDYYDDRRSKDMFLLPTKATSQILINYQLLFKATDNGGLILARIIDTDGTLQVPILNSDNFKLSFYLQSSSPYFYNRTNLDLKPSPVFNLIPNRRGFYFNNLERNILHQFEVSGFPKIGEEITLKHLSKDTNKEVSVSDSLIYLPAVFRIRFNAATNSFNIKVKDTFGNDVVPTKTFTAIESFKEFEIRSAKDLNLSDGFYNVSINGNAPQHVYISDQVFSEKPFGLIEIFHPSNLNDFDFLKTEGIVPNEKIQVKEGADYYVWFKSRELKWRYVFPKSLLGNEDILITGGTLKNGNLIVSNDKFELKESYTKVEFIKGGNVVKPLPNPTGKVIKLTDDNPAVEVAEVFL